jgi:hypothetical protein
MGEIFSLSRRQLEPTEGRLAYAKVVGRVAYLQQPSGSHKSAANGSAPSAPSSEAATRHMYHGGISDFCVVFLKALLKAPK